MGAEIKRTPSVLGEGTSSEIREKRLSPRLLTGAFNPRSHTRNPFQKRAMVEKRLAACVNLVPQITSIYEWKGEIEEDSEVLMMIKTQSSLVPALTDFVRSVHPYEVAEVIALPVEQGNPPYLQWVRQVTESAPDSSTAPL
uniref:CutA divalent cation tolerance homolog n=1 Tax=Capra hircus TaxID=9925 RepID=A0A8C2S9E8_CAPHI